MLSLSTVDGNRVGVLDVDGKAGLLAVGALVGRNESRVELSRVAGLASIIEVAKGDSVIVGHIGESDGVTWLGDGGLRGEG